MAQQKSGIIVHNIFILCWTVIGCCITVFLIVLTRILFHRLPRIIARLWLRSLITITGIKITVHHIERLNPKCQYIFLANHSSLLDIPALASSLKHHLSFIAKRELFMIPIFGWGMAGAGHIWIDRRNPRKARSSILRAVRILRREHISLVLFPEGTRTENGLLGPFKRGSFSLALEAGVPIVPVAIKGLFEILPKRRALVIPGPVDIYIGEPISTEGLGVKDKKELSETVRRRIAEMLGQG